MMNTLLGKQKTLNFNCPTIDSNNISDPLLISNHFNDHFTNTVYQKGWFDCLPLCFKIYHAVLKY